MAGGEAARAAVWRLWDRIGVYVLVLLVPALLVGAGLWEMQRAAGSLKAYGLAARELPAMRDEAAAVAAREPMAMLQYGGPNGRTIPATIAKAELDEAVGFVRRGAALSRIRQPFAFLTAVGGAIALAAGVAGMVVAAQAGQAARRSRDQLVQSFGRVHRLLPWILGAVLVGFAAALLGLAVFEAISLWFWDRISTGAFKLMALGLMLAVLAVVGAAKAVAGLRKVLALATPEPFDEEARAVAEADAPGLWRFVREVATRQGAQPPDAIAVGLQGGFYVTEHPVRLQPEGRVLDGRTLHLPAPYLELLDRDELGSVVGHELAHFVGEDTAYSRHFSPIYLGLERALGTLAPKDGSGAALNPAFQLGHHTLERFDHAVKHWGRLREFEADRLSAAVSGPRPAASALLRTGVIAPVVDWALDQRFQAPDANAPDLIAEMADAVRAKGWPDMTEHLEHRATHPTDTHPSTPQRIEKLNLAVDDALVAQATRPPAEPAETPGAQLFADWLATRRRLTDDFAGRARTAHAEHRQHLETTAAAVGTEAVELFENVRPMMWLMGVVAALFAAGAVAMVVGADAMGFGNDPSAVAIFGGVCLFFAICFGVFTALLRGRLHVPVMVLSADALTTRRLREPVRWLEIDGYGVSAGAKLELVLAIAGEAAMPQKVGWSTRTSVSRRKRLVTLQCYGIRGMRAKAVSDLVGRYLAAARARAALEG